MMKQIKQRMKQQLMLIFLLEKKSFAFLFILSSQGDILKKEK
jgi:hypothetical protein